MVVFKLPLVSPERLGRRFQYALLSLDPDLADIDEASGYVVFESFSDYLDLVDKALNEIKYLTKYKSRKNCSGVTVRGIDCCSLHEGPSLYSIGSGDKALFKETDLAECPCIRSIEVNWNNAAVCYADLVLKRGSPLNSHAKDLPWLAKITVYSSKKYRGAGGLQEFKTPRFTLDTLGSVLLGGAISFLWSERLETTSRARGGSEIEFYLLPDAVHRGFAKLRSIMLSNGLSRGSIARAMTLVKNYPVSLEIALALTLAEDLANNLSPAIQLSAYPSAFNLEKSSTILVLENKGYRKRPIVRSIFPLSIIIYASYSSSTIKAMTNIANDILNILKNTGKFIGLRDVIGRCIVSMYLQAVDCGWSDHVSSCIRDLYTAADHAEAENISWLAAKLRRLASRLSADYVAMASKCIGPRGC